jgi:hypothetical protein
VHVAQVAAAPSSRGVPHTSYRCCFENVSILGSGELLVGGDLHHIRIELEPVAVRIKEIERTAALPPKRRSRGRRWTNICARAGAYEGNTTTHSKASAHHSASPTKSGQSRTTMPRQRFNNNLSSHNKVKTLLPNQTGGCGCGPAPCQCKLPGPNGTVIGTRIIDANGKVTDVPATTTPKSPDTGKDRPSKVGDRDGRGDRNRGGGIISLPPRYVERPGYSAPRPIGQPPSANDDPVCLQSTWVMQESEEVCLSLLVLPRTNLHP